MSTTHDQAEEHPVALITARKVAERNGVCSRTVDRWVETGILPQPLRINGRKYWPDNVKPTAAA